MPEQELREVIAEAIYDADPLKESDPAMFQMLKGAAYYPGSIAHEAAIMQADAVLAALVARVPDGISEEIRKYGNVCWSQGFAAGAKANVEDIERHAEARQAAGMFLRALVAATRPGVTVPEFTALNLPPMSDDSSWITADDVGSQIKQRIQGIAIHSEIAAHYHGLREDDGDENDLISRKHYDLRNDAMRDVHRLVDALTTEATDEH
jgi:hypothetical protein